jgi:hypothetical protein
MAARLSRLTSGFLRPLWEKIRHSGASGRPAASVKSPTWVLVNKTNPLIAKLLVNQNP